MRSDPGAEMSLLPALMLKVMLDTMFCAYTLLSLTFCTNDSEVAVAFCLPVTSFCLATVLTVSCFWPALLTACFVVPHAQSRQGRAKSMMCDFLICFSEFVSDKE